LLSRFPITERHSRNDYSFRIETNVLYHSRGVLDVRVQVNPQYSFRAVVAHLKSRRQHDLYDQTIMRHQEARLLRAHVERALERDPALNMVVMGDMNDAPETATIQTILGQSPFRLVDLLPQDRTGGYNTHLWRFRGQWSRIDYLFVSPGMTNESVAGSARIADVPGWDKASDHRAVSASFRPEEPLVLDGDDDPHPHPKPAVQPATNRRLIVFALISVFVVADGLIVVWLLRRRPKS
jgi:endonuclease/exonuclease/phosphatase family metal-dependent hydrolase